MGASFVALAAPANFILTAFGQQRLHVLPSFFSYSSVLQSQICFLLCSIAPDFDSTQAPGSPVEEVELLVCRHKHVLTVAILTTLCSTHYFIPFRF